MHAVLNKKHFTATAGYATSQFPERMMHICPMVQNFEVSLLSFEVPEKKGDTFYSSVPSLVPFFISSFLYFEGSVTNKAIILLNNGTAKTI